MNSYFNKKIIDIEEVARVISVTSRISKPSLRLILETAKEKGFIKFTHNKTDSRSWIIEPKDITITDFNSWSRKWINID